MDSSALPGQAPTACNESSSQAWWESGLLGDAGFIERKAAGGSLGVYKDRVGDSRHLLGES